MEIFQYFFTISLGFFIIKIWAVFSDIAKLVTSYQKDIPGISQCR